MAVITSAEALGLVKGVATLLKPVYLQIAEHFPEGIPLFVKVSTHSYDGEGLALTPVLAYHLNQLGLLGEQSTRSQSGFGMTDYTRYFSSRPLDTKKLYDYLADEALPAPQAVSEPVS